MAVIFSGAGPGGVSRNRANFFSVPSAGRIILPQRKNILKLISKVKGEKFCQRRSPMNSFEMMLIPSNYGMIKVYIYGFYPPKGMGKVYASLDDTVVSCKGTCKKKTIIRALSKLNEILSNQK
jgi:hypothetical protein